MGNQVSTAALNSAGEKGKLVRRSNSAPSLIAMAKGHNLKVDEEPAPGLAELSEAFSELTAAMESSSRMSLLGRSSRRSSMGTSSTRLALIGSRTGSAANANTNDEEEDKEERRNRRRERRRKNRESNTGVRKRRSRSNTRLEVNEMLETGEFLEMLMATPQGQEKLRQVMVDNDVLGRVATITVQT